MADDVRILGADTHIPRKNAPWLLGGAALVAFLALRSKASAAPASGSSVASSAVDTGAQTDLEFVRIQQQAASELAQLTAANKLESQAMEYAYRQSGAGQRMCIPSGQYYSLDAATRKSLQNRVANGQSEKWRFVLTRTNGTSGPPWKDCSIISPPLESPITGRQIYLRQGRILSASAAADSIGPTIPRMGRTFSCA